MITTVVGSYPASPRGPSSIASKISEFFGTYDKYKPAIALAVHDQIKAGVDIISDGQTRGNMIKTFAGAMPGMAIEGKVPKIIGKITPLSYSIGASDLRFAMKTAKNKVKGVKGIVTGPTTLVFSSRIDGFYNKKEDAILDLAYALKKEAEYLEDAGAFMIQIDEPILSTGTADIKVAKKAIKIITNDLSSPVSLHVCGDIADIFNDLIKFSVNIIDCEFAGLPRNLDVPECSKLEGKKIGFGCIDTKTEQVEKIDEAYNLIKRGVDLVGEDNMIIDPDCGMRMLSRNAAFSKLKVMVEASKCQF